MRLKVFKTLWGFEGDYRDAIRSALREGFDGIEGPVPASKQDVTELAMLLEDSGLAYIAEIATTGSYVPDRRLGLQDHLDDLAAKLVLASELQPLLVTCLGGCDAWSQTQSLEFLQWAMDLADRQGLPICFETHRGRSLFNPWVTRQIVDLLPEVRITCDFSHWYVVCEGLQQGEEEIIRSLLGNAGHIHGRVGYDQGPQVPDPRSALYAAELHRHLQWWRWIWLQHINEKRDYTTVTPEFGPDGYDYRDPVTGMTLIKPALLNHWMAGRLRDEYSTLQNGQ